MIITFLNVSSAAKGFYDGNNNVTSVNASSLNKLVISKPYVILMQFYHSQCRYSRKFAASYQKLAELLYPWRHLLKVMAFDCTENENKVICGEYQVKRYPTLRYFHLNYEGWMSSIGVDIGSQEIDDIKTAVAREMVKENSTDSTWLQAAENIRKKN